MGEIPPASTCVYKYVRPEIRQRGGEMSKINPQRFQDRLQEIKDRGNYSQRQLAERFGVNQSTISRWLAGKQTPKEKNASEVRRKVRQGLQTAKRRERRRQEALLATKAKRVTAPAVMDDELEIDEDEIDTRTRKPDYETAIFPAGAGLERHDEDEAAAAIALLGQIQGAHGFTNEDIGDFLDIDPDSVADLKNGFISSDNIDDIQELNRQYGTEPGEIDDIPF